MKNFIRATLLVATLLAMARASEAQVAVGIVIGAPPPPRVAVIFPERPEPASVWIEGYWYQWENTTNGMKAIGLAHRMRELIGSHRATTASGIMRGTGREHTAALNMITTRITIETATSTITTDMVITTATTTTTTRDNAQPLGRWPKRRL